MKNKDDYIGNYCITKKISNGAFGDVYLAQHTFLTNRTVAIKVLRSVHLGSTEERDRFFEEAQFLEKLKHPHILSVIDVGVHEDCPYLVTEYASKGSLRDLLQRHSSQLLSIKESINILTQVGQALDYAHKQNIIHRDLKPENIIFNSEGKAILADFGIATVLNAATRQTTTMGTLHYMAPEQFRNTIAKQSDQYALGCIAYELFTGHMVFDASDAPTIMMKCVLENPIALRQYNPKLPLAIEEAVLKALAKERADRHTDVGTFIAVLNNSISYRYDAPSNTKVNTQNTDERTYTYWLDVATAHIEARRYKEALAAYQQLILLGYKNTDILYGKGNMLYRLEHYQEALEAFQSAIDLDTEYAGPYCGKGFALLSLDKYEEALAAFADAISIDKNYVSAFRGRGKALEALQHYKSALIAYERVIYSEPDNLDAWLSKGSVLLALNRYKEALEAYDYSILINKNIAYTHYMKGITLQLLKCYQDALVSYNRAIDIAPDNNAYAYRFKGQILEQMQLYQEAVTAYEQALRLKPDMLDILDSKNRLQKMLQAPLMLPELVENNEDEEEEYGEEEYDGDEDEFEEDDEDEDEFEYSYSDNVTSSIAYYHQGIRLKQKQQYDKSAQLFKKAIQFVPTFTNAYRELGYILQQLKRYKEALTIYEQAIKLASTEPSLYKSKAEVLEKLGKLEEAKQTYGVAKALTENAANWKSTK